MSEYSNILTRVDLIGKRIKAERTAKKYTQAELSQKIGIGVGNRGNFSDWEKGRSLPDLKTMLALCEVFDCDLEWLLCNPNYTCKTKQVTDIQVATGLSEEAIKAIREITFTDRFSCRAKDKREAFSKFLTADTFPVFFYAIFNLHLSLTSPQQQEFEYFDDAINYMDRLSYRMKVEHYELNEALTLLIDEIFPKPNVADLSNLSIKESFEEYREREENYYNELEL